jgi:hypothetical protein
LTRRPLARNTHNEIGVHSEIVDRIEKDPLTEGKDDQE